jgi:hypothetical protein
MSYMIAGASGASLNATDYAVGPYPGKRFPTPSVWKNWASGAQKLVAKLHLEKSAVSSLIRASAGLRGSPLEADPDLPQNLSLIVVDNDPVHGTRITPLFLDDLELLYPGLPDGSNVSVQEGQPSVDPAALNARLATGMTLTM